MGRRYYRRYRRRGKSELGAVLLLFLAVAFWPITLIYFLIKIIAACVRSAEKASHTKRRIRSVVQTVQESTAPTNGETAYSARDSIMTDCEKAFFTAFSNVLGDTYILQPQINLASIIRKEADAKYQNELFRNIDFGVFDKNYSLKLLIEINDSTHKKPDRVERDKKVRAICEKAGVPLIAFWTQYGVNEQYIRNRLAKYLPLLRAQAQLPIQESETYNGR